MHMKPDRAQKIILTCCVLHNFLINDHVTYCPAGFSDTYLEDGTIVEGDWRRIIPDNSLFLSSSNISATNGRPPQNAKEIRECIKNYVNSSVGKLPWSNK